MNVCFLHGSNDLYGASKVLLHDAHALRSVGHEVAVQLPTQGPLSECLRRVGCSVGCAPFPVLRRSAALDVIRPGLFRASSLLADADVVVANTLAVVPALLPLYARRTRPRLITSVHELLAGRGGRSLAHLACTVSDALLVNSLATERWLLVSNQAGKLTATAYPVAPSHVADEAAPTGSSERRGMRVILAGRLSGRKGHLELAMACDHLRQEGHEISLTLAGGPFPSAQQVRAQAELQAFAAHRNWIDCVGEVGGEELSSHLRTHDLHVVATRELESFGLVILEAWAVGTPSLAPALGGAAEAAVLTEGACYGRSGVEFVAALVSSLRFLIANPGARKRTRADAPARELCTSERRAAAWERLLESRS